MSYYSKTQRVYYQIPIAVRARISSIGTQIRLLFHLKQLGVECCREEFRIAENPESLRIQKRNLQLMCEGANDTEIKYIDI